MSTQALIIDTAVKWERAGLFYVCRRFLLQSLYTDLRHISDPTDVSSLPTPATPAHPHGEHILSRSSSIEEISLLPIPVSADGSGWTLRRPQHSHSLSDGDALHNARAAGAGGMLEKVLETAASQLTHSNVSRGVFGTVFAETGTLFVLVLFQAMDILHEPCVSLIFLYYMVIASTSGRVMNFRGSLLASSALTLLACPILELHLLTFGRSKPHLRPTPLRLLSVFIPFLVYVFLLFQIPLPPIPTPTLFDSFLARLILLGVIILSTLSAIASLHAAHALLLALRSAPPPKPTDITSLEHSLARLRNDLAERTREQERLAEARGEVGFWSRFLGKGAREDSALRGEVSAMRVLEEKMGRELEALRLRKERMEYSRTLKGRIWNFATAIFGVYCAIRIISVVSNLILPFILHRNSSAGTRPEWNVPDIITYVLALAVAHLPFVDKSSVDIQLLGRQISLVLVGVVVGGNVRLIFRNMAKVLKVSSRNMLASFLLLILSQIMGMYLLSTLVQLRSSVPSSSANTAEPLFALLPRFEVFGKIFDLTFFGTCVCWGVWRAGAWLWIEG
ncbi:hypothetical protein DACRYDRAFT_119942 [Dacryopinax primogenitus]|uniref:Abscisic acid G-protein coupled receptor-like domain-containing protein n=1 Tax=Dacryopinax primogenitus (strain DJM 731) TaxID=1858805 RepID=M5FN30_DACPD|nr:uncharacterized protein DACRYDRAFT_119942 [Dacryopinax primogenitus]EJT96730.1 hypothetical protein DACRYDRAFT_119942 [Dacryopinax primogenitus]